MYLYQCYVTGSWWQCDDLVTVDKDVMKTWNPDSQTITISTNSEAGRKEQVDVEFYDTEGSTTGFVSIHFNAEIEYRIGRCKKGNTRFPETLPTDTEKTWTITYNHTEQTVVFHCNGVQVADVVLSSVYCDARSNWTSFWGRKPTQMEFSSNYDTASDKYCFSSNPGKYNGVIDSGERTKTGR